MKDRFYPISKHVVVNLLFTHSIAMNENGQAGWIRLIKEVNGKLLIYPITPAQFAEICKRLKVLNECAD